MKRFNLLFALLLMCAITVQADLPSVIVQDLQGHAVQVNYLSNDEKPMVIAFFATWCKPCMRELKAIQEYYDDWQEDLGVKMIIVSVDEGQDVLKVQPLVDGFGWDYEVLLDPSGEFKRAMGVQSIPHSFVLDGQGNIVHNHVGYTDGDESTLDKQLRGLK